MTKSYLSQQVKLMTLNTTDLMTDAEYDIYKRIVELRNEIDRLSIEANKSHQKIDTGRKKELLTEKKAAQKELNEEVMRHMGNPRTVRVQGVIDTRRLLAPEMPPEGISWRVLRASRQIAEFMSDLSRQMNLKANDITFDKVIVSWKNFEILHQIVLDGFYLPVMHENGSVEQRHFRFVTASAGQLRTDKIVCMSDDAWKSVEKHVLGGLSYEYINAHGGLNIAKLFAYTALCCGATEIWNDVSLDQTIVIKDFSNDRTGLLDFIKDDYTVTRGVYTVSIKDTDGCGMALPEVLAKNQMIRGMWTKGLITPFDFLQFCDEHGVAPVIEDAWGLKHDLRAEGIKMILTTSQVKLWKFYDSWDHFKRCAKENNWTWLATNYEENYIPDSPLNYQFIETLVDMTDEEIDALCERTWSRIRGMANDQDAMLRTMRADEYALTPYNRALALYPALLRDGYTRETLKAIKRRWTMDAQSGKLICDNKRLYVIPDFYAACEYWFLGDKNPKGLLEDGEVACRLMNDVDEIDILRSPHLYMEHAVRKVTHDYKVYRWLSSRGIYYSCHDLISRILQFDCDGDQLNACKDPTLISVAKRNIKEHDIVPLFYDANDVPPEQITQENLYIGLVRAHNASGIGMVSNNLCKLWNSDNPDYDAAKLLCFYNNQVNTIAPSRSDV